MELIDNFGELLKESRKKANLTCKTLAEIIDVDISYISKIENNKVKPSIEKAFQICNILNIDESKIITNDIIPNLLKINSNINLGEFIQSNKIYFEKKIISLEDKNRILKLIHLYFNIEKNVNELSLISKIIDILIDKKDETITNNINIKKYLIFKNMINTEQLKSIKNNSEIEKVINIIYNKFGDKFHTSSIEEIIVDGINGIYFDIFFIDNKPINLAFLLKNKEVILTDEYFTDIFFIKI